jgi:L,D-transpeptidase YcbB
MKHHAPRSSAAPVRRHGAHRGVRRGARLRAHRLAPALTVALAAGMVLAGCGDDKELEALRGAAVAELLASASEDSVLRLSDGDTLHVSAATLAFYRGRSDQAAWVGPKGLLPKGLAVHQAVGASVEDGLPPVRYRHDLALDRVARLEMTGDTALSDTTAVRTLADLDVLLTEGFNRMARDLVAGMLDPEEAGLDYRIVKDRPPADAILNRVLTGQAPAEIVAQLRPAIPHYDRMRAALRTYHEAEARDPWPQVRIDSTLKEGGRADAVAQVRQRLVDGVNTEEAALALVGAADPSLFDADLARAVELFQDRHAIVPDGTVGEATARELNYTLADRIAELRLNLDRWRWLPDHLGDRYVIVNIAGFELEVVEQGRIIESMNVVVGQLTNQTPIFSDSIRFVVVNPYWNVPDGIMARTIQPAMDRDPTYLARHDMEIVDGRVRQRPGPQNSLGRYKFIFPNEFDVYLHDTPEGHLFARTERAFSSGCVRIERPRDFARMLLRLQSDLDPDSLDPILANGEEQWLKLDRPLPVYLLYFTAWAQEDGTVRFHRDVYNRSEAMDDQAEEMVTPVRS